MGEHPTAAKASPVPRVSYAGSFSRARVEFMLQVVRNLTPVEAGTCRVLICDRDAKWSQSIRARLQEAGLRVIQTPYRAPNANAYAERFVRSIKEECLDRLIPFGERHLRRAVAEFVAHYHWERTHQGLGNELIECVPTEDASDAFDGVNVSVGCSTTTRALHETRPS